MTEPRDEREVKADVELRTPQWLPGVKLGLSYRRLWDKRANSFVYETAELANMSEETLLGRINEGDGLADAFQNAAERAIKDGDPVVRDVLGSIIGQFRGPRSAGTSGLLLPWSTPPEQPLHTV